MRVLGIDPGTRLAGYGVIDGEYSRFRHVDNGVLIPPSAWPVARRLAYLQTELRRLLAEFQPDCVAVEEAFVAKNPQTALKLGMARGVFFAECVQAGLAVHEYAPAMVKKSVSGGGRASKDQVLADGARSAGTAGNRRGKRQRRSRRRPLSFATSQPRSGGAEMIAGLSGRLKRKEPGSVWIDTGGVWYECLVSLSTLAVMPEVGDTTELFVHTHVREDALLLFGLRRKRKRSCSCCFPPSRAWGHAWR